MQVMEDTVSKLSLLIETPTSIRRSDPEVVWEMVMLEPAVVPEEMASTWGMLEGSGVAVGVAVLVSVEVGVDV